jgi:glucose-6-phosphate dehydrogenase assembly protein OpcA
MDWIGANSMRKEPMGSELKVSEAKRADGTGMVAFIQRNGRDCIRRDLNRMNTIYFEENGLEPIGSVALIQRIGLDLSCRD